MVIVKRKEWTQKKSLSEQKVCNGDSFLQGEYGAYVDIGTTTVVVALYNLHTGEFYGSRAEENAQVIDGKDVMMRIMHCLQGREEALQEKIVGQVERLLGELSDGVCEPKQVKQLSVVGNTAMCHIFLGKDVVGLAGAPFESSYHGAWNGFGEDIGFQTFASMHIYVLPCIGGHVGADAAAVLFGEDLTKEDRLELAIDLGTNAEILLNCHGKLYACSAAAGPAFEGGGIKCGMRAKKGAVTSVKMAKKTSNIIMEVLDGSVGEDIRGICGSGLIDAIAGMHQIGVMEDSGYLIDRDTAYQKGLSYFFEKSIEEVDGERQFTLYPQRLWITQDDVRNFQLAKAAVAAGIDILCQKAGVSLEQFDAIYIAGMFGTFLHPEHAVALGLLPNVSLEKLFFIGNAAGRGALKALFFSEFRSKVENSVDKVQHVELALQEDFQKSFLGHIAF